ncbi:ABC transporter permease [Bacillus sp. SCS-151]|uniref:ABC transporter permease n=1 Tax=Nanhaiella sioensis TaxID=3115293 RepID=UPI003979FC5E
MSYQLSNEEQVKGEGLLMLYGVRQWLVECVILFRIQFSMIREQWIWVFILASLFPFSTLLFLKFFTVNPTDEMMIQIISGNMIFSIILTGFNMVAQELSWQKHLGHFTFYASLPIAKINFVLANLLRGLLSTMPSIIILAIIGQLVYGVQLQYSWGIIPVFFLSIFSIVGFGVFIGFWSPNPQLGNMLVQGLWIFLSFLTPVLMPIEQLPEVLQWISYIFPTTYIAEAFRTIFISGWDLSVSINLVILFGYSIFSFLLIMKKMDWRVN